MIFSPVENNNSVLNYNKKQNYNILHPATFEVLATK